MSNNINIEDISKQCFGRQEYFSSKMPQEIVKIIKENREKRRAEIREQIEIATMKKKHGKNVKIVENKQKSKLEKIKERLRMKLLQKEARKIG